MQKCNPLENKKMISSRVKLGLVVLNSVLVSLSGSQAFAAQKSKGTAVVWPIVYSDNTGTKTARSTGVQSVDQALQKGGYTLVPENVAASNWKSLHIPAPATGAPATTAEIVKFGRDVHATYVVAPVFHFHTRSIWVNVGPRTVSTALVSVTITNTKTGKVVYRKVNVKGRSDAKNSILKDVGDVLVTPLVTVVSGGPKTPEEQRAVQIAVAFAMEGFVNHKA